MADIIPMPELNLAVKIILTGEVLPDAHIKVVAIENSVLAILVPALLVVDALSIGLSSNASPVVANHGLVSEISLTFSVVDAAMHCHLFYLSFLC